MSVINQIGAALEGAINNPASFESAAKIYNGMYRSEPIALSSFSKKEQHQILHEAHFDKAFAEWEAKNGFEKKQSEDSFPWRDGDDYDYEPDPIDVFRSETGYQCPDVSPLINSDIKVCALCNYKGEAVGAEYALYEDVKHLRVFVSRYNYE